MRRLLSEPDAIGGAANKCPSRSSPRRRSRSTSYSASEFRRPPRSEDFPSTASPWSFGGGGLVFGLLTKLLRREFGSDLLAGISIVASALLGEYLAGAFVVLMLSGGEALEAYAVGRASSVLEALARRMPLRAYRKQDGGLSDVPLAGVAAGGELVILHHEICPVDGTVLDGRGTTDESFPTGEPYQMSKVPGSQVNSGAINGVTVLTIRAEKRAGDSRYARIMRAMRATEQHRPRLRRLGDHMGAIYTPLDVALAAWAASRSASSP